MQSPLHFLIKSNEILSSFLKRIPNFPQTPIQFEWAICFFVVPTLKMFEVTVGFELEACL